MNKIIIDTSSNEEVVVGIEVDGNTSFRKESVGRHKAQEVLPMLDKLLTEKNLLLKDITALDVDTGPGSFTGLRVGVSIANTLATLLHIPINGMPVGKIAQPVYSK